jgi:hypothetical protein
MSMTHGPDDEVDRLESEELAALIVDALLRASILKRDDLERAVEIVAEEIEARKNIGDY